MVDPFEVSREWGGRLRPIEFCVPKPLLPSRTVTFLHYAGVPKRFEVTAHQVVRFDFVAIAANLSELWARDMPDYSLPVGWGRLWRIGDITYTQAKAWLCNEELSGKVIAVDIDIDSPLHMVNGSIAGMVLCMRILYDWTQSAGESLSSMASLVSALTQAPVLSEDEAAHFWLLMLESAIESGCERIQVDCE